MYGPLLFSLAEKPVFKEDVDKQGGSNFSAVDRKFSSSCTVQCQDTVPTRYLSTRTSDLNVRLDWVGA